MGNVATNLLHKGEKNTDVEKDILSSQELASTCVTEASCVNTDSSAGLEKKVNEPESTETNQLQLEEENTSKIHCETQDQIQLDHGDDQEAISQTSSVVSQHEHSAVSHHLKLSQVNKSQSKSLSSSFSSSLANSITLEMGLDSELQEKWFLTFEQFVSGLNKEPDLCQFFAEQNLLDLTGASSVDPVLNSYTRTVLATSPL